MATTSDYLSELVEQKTALANNLVTKGVEANKDEKFNTLVPKVLDIPSGSEPQFGDDFPILDGNTHYWVNLYNEYDLNLIIRIYGTGTITVNWGDGITEELSLVSLNSNFISHAYNSIGRYRIDLSGGEFFYKDSSMRRQQDISFASAIEIIELGENTVVDKMLRSALCQLINLKKIGINVSENTFYSGMEFAYDCYNLESIEIFRGKLQPRTYGATGGSWYAFSQCYNLKKIDFENTENDSIIGTNTFDSCMSLPIIDLRTWTSTVINGKAFSNCLSLKKVYLPPTITSINASSFNEDNQQMDIYVPWAEDEVANAPWGAVNATIHYNYTESEEE